MTTQPKPLRAGTVIERESSSTVWIGTAAALAWTPAPELAHAALEGVIPSALAASGHYFCILVAIALLTFERVTVAAEMSPEAEKSCVIADASYGLIGVGIVVSGYFRLVEYGKGWEFYAHEPFFCVKLAFAGILGGLSLFPTTIFVQRGSKIFQNEPVAPMSEKLAARLHQILNAEISAVLTIPLTATLMARGVGYNADFPWQVGAGLAAATLVGTSGLYLKQALGWSEDNKVEEQDS